MARGRRVGGRSAPAALLAAIGLACVPPALGCDASAELLITEFMASNITTLTDGDGDYADWVEIYDPCLPSVSLDGWYLTDDAANLTKWRFPAVTLTRGGSLVVFASGKNRAVAGAELHTSFKLAAEGEYLALVKPDGTTVAHAFSPAFPPQYPDVAYGLPQSSITPVPRGATARYRVPSAADAGLGTSWTGPAFDDAGWSTGATGLGFDASGAGFFDVTCYRASIAVPDLGTAEAVIADPALQLSIQTAQPPVINYLNTGGAGHFGSDASFPGMLIGTDVNDFVVLVTGTITLPAAGPWTFGVNSDDGFGMEISRQPYVFTTSFPNQRGASDTLAVFNIPEPGQYALRLVFFERGGGSGLELFAAPGSLSSFSGAFRLVGNTAEGGLPVTSLASLIGTDVRTPMLGLNASLWGRVPFDVADPGAVDLLTLRASYEDGFVAFLNGVEVARRNAPATLEWNSAAGTDRPVGDAPVPEEIDLTAQAGLLQTGANVLAFQGLNDAATEGAFLVLPELTGVGPTSTVAPAFLVPATPGRYNGFTYPGVSGKPSFSHASGTFSSPFSLQLSAAAPAALIRFTLDGSDPTETQGTVYSEPLSISDSTRIRARVFEPGLAPGQVITRLYAKLAPDVLSFSSNLPLVVVDTFGGGLTQEFLTETLTTVIPTTGARAGIVDPPGFAGLAGLRIRGSSSTSFPKKQFFLETWDDTRDDLSVSLLGMPLQSDWILYAPYTDKTLMRDALAYKWSNDIGRYAVRTRFVEVFLRTAAGPVSAADYAGVYVLEEKIKQDVNRVNLVDLQPEDAIPPAVTGGYILKKDRLDPGDLGFALGSGLRLAYVEPKEEEITAAQAAWLSGWMNEMEAALAGPDFAADYLDTDSFIDHHILVEMTKNIDGYRLSTFMFKDRGGKLTMGPIWDYNLTLGNANYLEGWLPAGWYYPQLSGTEYPWWPRLFEDPEFRLRYADRWFAFRRGPLRTEALLGDIDGAAALLDEAQARNYARWPILGTYVWPNWFIGTTYASEIDWMKQWLAERLLWIDGQFPAPPLFNHAPGEVPTGFALTVTAASGTVYYTLDGSDPRLPGGAVAPGALPYGGPLSIDQVRQIRARSFDGSAWSALNEGTFAPVPPAYVNEVLAANVTQLADEQGDFDPWIELYNPFPATADLAGAFLTDDPQMPDKWQVPAGTTLCGGRWLLVWADNEPLEGPLHANFRLDPAGGTLWLYAPSGLALDSFPYPALGSNVSYGRTPDGGPTLAPFVHATPAAENRDLPTRIVLNEYNGVAPTRLLSGTGTDVFFGRVTGNGGDWFELVVVEDHLDLRGFQVRVRDNGVVTTLTFTQAPLLADLRSGTIVTVAASLASDVSYAPLSGDWWIHLGLDGLYLTGSFSVSHQDTQITLLDPAGNVVFGPAGEGIHPQSGVGNDEVLKLEESPGPATTAFSTYNDGSTSSFGAPNLWSGGSGVQDLSALRNPVLLACAGDAACADGNPCTDDTCVAGHCQNVPNAAPCDDGDPCTSPDVCADRQCGGQALSGCCFADCDCDDGNACTVSACDGGTGFCAFLGGACAVQGTLRYYRDSAGGGSEPSAKPVSGVGIDRTGDGTADATTDGSGGFTFAGLSGDLTVLPLPREGGSGGAVSSFDASVIGRAAAQLLTLTPGQTVAADVTGDGTVSALDASLVGRFAAELLGRFPIADAAGSDWAFLPPFHAYAPLEGGETPDFAAVLYGDVTGNWAPSPARIAAVSSADERSAMEHDLALASTVGVGALSRPWPRSASATLALTGWTGPLHAGKRRDLTIVLDQGEGILGLDLLVRYDPASLRIVGIASSRGLAHGDRDGLCRIASYGTAPLAGSAPIVTLTVEALRGLGARSPLQVSGVADEGAVLLLSPGSSGSAGSPR
ncbi:MAG TPA: CotH kinase family protein [Candidatus Polarisedimenticolaceae bacterium]|nr:CotH kinase family protein [Candidatus Polarisedimenticolaceae bacterium]